nr:MAG TPA: hypothetical protein [Caudoviricetes sp.]
MISYGNERVLMHRIKNEKVPSLKRLEKLMLTQPEFVEEQAGKAICEYKKVIVLTKQAKKLKKPICEPEQEAKAKKPKKENK